MTPEQKKLVVKDVKKALLFSFITTICCLIFPALSLAQAINIDLGTGAGLTERVVQLIGLLTVLTLAPSIVIMTTSFVRIVVVLSLLRTALGLQQSPPNAVIVSLALFLTAIVMAPTFQQAYDAGIKPLMAQEMALPEAFTAASSPVKTFMLSQAKEDDLALFVRRAEAGVRDRVPAVRAVPGHRPGGGERADEHGHDDAAACGGVPAVQADLLRPGGRLAAGGGIAGGELPSGRGRGARITPEIRKNSDC